MADEQRAEEVQPWRAKRRAALVISLLKGETTAAEAARRHGLKLAEVPDWHDRFLLRGGEFTSWPEGTRMCQVRNNRRTVCYVVDAAMMITAINLTLQRRASCAERGDSAR
jgi:hypothetical protein